MNEKQQIRALKSDWGGFIWRLLAIAALVIVLGYTLKACYQPPAPQQKGPFVKAD